MNLVTLDLEGVLIPEIWIAFADAAGIPELRRTTRDEPDYDKLMRYRLGILAERGVKLADISRVISGLEPLDGAREFMEWLKSRTRAIILSDTFEQFAAPLMAKLGSPTLFCHELEIAPDGAVSGYRLRMPDQKRRLSRLSARSILRLSPRATLTTTFPCCAPPTAQCSSARRTNSRQENPDLPVARDYAELKAFFSRYVGE